MIANISVSTTAVNVIEQAHERLLYEFQGRKYVIGVPTDDPVLFDQTSDSLEEMLKDNTGMNAFLMVLTPLF